GYLSGRQYAGLQRVEGIRVAAEGGERSELLAGDGLADRGVHRLQLGARRGGDFDRGGGGAHFERRVDGERDTDLHLLLTHLVRSKALFGDGDVVVAGSDADENVAACVVAHRGL